MRLNKLKPRIATLQGRQILQPGERFNYGRRQDYQRLYNYQWQKTRARFLKENPLCVDCKKETKITPATEVDHIIPHKGSKELFWDSDNWQPLCASCHSRKTIREGGFGNEYDQESYQQSLDQTKVVGEELK